MTAEKTSAKRAMEKAIGVANVSELVDRHTVDGLTPHVVVTPNSVDELARVMSSAYEGGLAVAPWGGGTRMDLGNPISGLDIVVDLTRMNKMVQHDAADLTVTVEAGITLSDLQRTLAAQGQFLAVDAAMPDNATIGGILASGTSGPLKWHYGSPRDLVIGMKVVQADGRVVKSGGQVVKNVSGYDMARLHIGSIGTLGIIAEVSFKLTPMPRQESTILAAFDSVSSCYTAAMSIFNSDVMPLSLTAFDANANQFGKFTSAASDSGSAFLAIRLGGRPRTLARFEKETLKLCDQSSPLSVEQIDSASMRDLWRKLTDFGWSENVAPELMARVSVLPSTAVDVASELGEAQGFEVAIVSQPGYGNSQVWWFGDGDPAAISTALSNAREAVGKLGGQMIVERCPTEAKANIDVWGDAGDPVKIMRSLKEQYDPKGIINPGRFMGRI